MENELTKRAEITASELWKYGMFGVSTTIRDLLAENARLKAAQVKLTGKANGGGEVDVIQAIKDAIEFVKHPANYPEKVFAVVVLTHLEQSLRLLTGATPPEKQGEA